MITRNQIIELLTANPSYTREQKQELVSDFCDDAGVSADDKAKILADLESYGEY